MPHHQFKSGFIRQVDYDSGERQLELTFENKTVLAYLQVPLWIFEKLCKDPSPKSFWEDHIADDFSKGIPKQVKTTISTQQKLKDLFGDGS